MIDIYMNSVHHCWVLAQVRTETAMEILSRQLIAAIVFSIVGILVLMGTLFALEKLSSFSLVHEITEEHNQALALILGAIVLGISLIIAAAMLG